MKTIKYSLTIIVFSILLFSCNKTIEDTIITDDNTGSLSQVSVDKDFNWQSALSGTLNITFQNPYNVSTEQEIINIIDSDGLIVSRTKIFNGKASFNVILPQNAHYYIYFPVTGDQLEIREIKDLVMELGKTNTFKESRVANDYTSCTSCNNPMENAGAEFPVINSGYTITHEDNVPGWETNANDNKIEIWKDGFNGVPAQEGNQFFELNANSVADLFQELCLEPGSSVTWSVWHRGRSGVDVAEVKIGSSVETAQTMAVMTDGTSAWGYYTGTYQVPEDETTTYFVFSSISSAGANSYGNFLDNFEIECDFDGDGTPDDIDDAPTDPNISYISAFPTSGKQIVAFEDLWPSLGDFDFNDLCMSNQAVINKDADFNIVSADFKVSIDAIGAGIHNGIGMMLYDGNGNALPDNVIESVTGDVVPDPNNANGLILSEDVYQTIEDFYQNNGHGPTNSTPDTIYFGINFNSGVLDFLPELYLFRTNDASHEVHRSIFPGTSQMNTSLFNTLDDNGNFQTANGIPWGIEIILDGHYSSPREKVEISEAYPEFLQWAQSGGTENIHWYETPIESKVLDIR